MGQQPDGDQAAELSLQPVRRLRGRTDPAGDANHGNPSRYCPRAALLGTLAQFKKLGLTPVVAVELEFYLFDRDRDGDGLPVAVKNPVTGQKVTAK